MTPAGDAMATRLAALPQLGLASVATPLEPMRRLDARAGASAVALQLCIKREDQAGLGFGGNKLRKLDTIVARALDAGADTLVSGVGVQSNSQRQVAAFTARFGLECSLGVPARA